MPKRSTLVMALIVFLWLWGVSVRIAYLEGHIRATHECIEAIHRYLP